MKKKNLSIFGKLKKRKYFPSKHKLNKMCFYFLFFFLAIAGYTQDSRVSLEELINNPDKYDQKSVSFKAEIIGDPLFEAGGGHWLNFSADGYYLGVFTQDASLVEKIKHWGSYQEKGDIIEVQGVFYKNCRQYNKRFLHLTSLEVAKEGGKTEHLVLPEKKRFAFLSFVICLTMGLIYFIKVRWQKKLKN